MKVHEIVRVTFDQLNASIFDRGPKVDERLAEDKRVNRLEDTFLLWQAICKSELLRNAIIICKSTLIMSPWQVY